MNNSQATAETFSSDGCSKTGDVMTLDDEGLLTVVDRQLARCVSKVPFSVNYVY